jgi:NAD(P)H-dependent flavin oxidoreductase YrpB (nitropropane dioxygenase family)
VATPVCEMLGIERPIVQAPMAAVPQLAAAVSNAGALGMVTLTWSADAAAVVHETAALTTRPFGGNFILTSDHHARLDAEQGGVLVASPVRVPSLPSPASKIATGGGGVGARDAQIQVLPAVSLAIPLRISRIEA